MIRQYLNTHKRYWLPGLVVLVLTALALATTPPVSRSDAPVKEWAR